MNFSNILEKNNKIKNGLILLRNSIIIYYYNKLQINPNLILLESQQGNDLGSSIFYLIKELSKDKYSKFKLVLSLKEDKFNDINNRLKNYKITNVEFVKIGTIKYYKYIYSAKYLFNDDSFPKNFIKKSQQIYLNTWNATLFKFFGRDSRAHPYLIGNLQKNFIMSDYLICPNEFIEKTLINGFMLKNISSTKIMSIEYPQASILFNNNNNNKYDLKNELNIQNKQIFVYMPTLRNDPQTQIKLLNYHLNQIDLGLTKNQILYVKSELVDDINFNKYNNIKKFPVKLEIYDFLHIVDCLVTDYSNIIFDFIHLSKKILLFPYDYEDYLEENGLYIPLINLSFPIVYDIHKLIDELNNEKNYDEKEFKEKFFSNHNENIPKLVCESVIFNKFSDELIIKEIGGNGKENVLIYSGNLVKNGITSSLLSLILSIDLKKRNYFLTFKEKSVNKYSKTISDLPKEISYLPLSGNFTYNFLDKIAYILFNKNISNNIIKSQLNKFFKRNLIKFLPFNNFKWFIQFTGYEKILTGMFQRLKYNKIIFAHNDMIQEIKTKGNQHLLTLNESYNNYDKVALVNDELKNSTLKIKGNLDNVTTVENTFDYKSIIKKSERNIEFDEDTESNKSIQQLKTILNSDSLKIITIGRFSKEKGHMRLLNVFNDFHKNNKNSYLVIIGGYGRLYEYTLEYARNLPCYKNIIIIKSISNPFTILKYCDLFVLSSFYEGLGLVLLEADVLGVRVFSTDVIGPRKLLQRYEGHLVENSEKGIKEGINQYLKNEITPLKIDYEDYNKKAIKDFESLFDNNM